MIEKGLLNISIGDYIGVLRFFIDNKNAGNISRNVPLNLTTECGAAFSQRLYSWSLQLPKL